jgi:hypothetical protein
MMVGESKSWAGSFASNQTTGLVFLVVLLFKSVPMHQNFSIPVRQTCRHRKEAA